MIEKINTKLKKIEKMLIDDKLLNKYIENIEKTEDQKFNIPVDLEIKLKTRIKDEQKLRPKLKLVINKKFIDVSKIAACTILALLLWQITFPSFITYASTDHRTYKIKGQEIYIKIDNGMKKLSKFFNSPIKFERREK
ncbi:MAG: hypothetical protein RSB67_03285 [Clostridia bacterium]